MFRKFENLIDPYTPYKETDTPPQRLGPFLMAYAQPFKAAFAITAFLAIAIAAVELGLIWYVGRFVDLLGSGPPGEVWATHQGEFIAVALFLLIGFPLILGAEVLLMNQTLLPNVGTLLRWRAHRQVLRQSVGWFENDFAGRIANRIMQTPPAAGDAMYQAFDGLAFAFAFLIGAGVLLAGADPRLLVPMLVWFLAYGVLVRWVIKRIGPASKASSNARSAVTGRVVDAYTNIHSVKLFAHHDREVAYAKDAIEEARTTFQVEMRLYTAMDMVLTMLNMLLVVGVVAWAGWLWGQGTATVGTVAVAATLTLRISNMSMWIMMSVSNFFRQLGVIAEGMETIAQPITLVDRPDAVPLALSRGEIGFDKVTHHYGRDTGGLQDLSLTIHPGEKVGVIGRSGAGKSTLVKLLLRFYDTEAGRILIDGQDIAGVTQDSLRAQIGMVSQESTLLHRSIYDNIAYGRPEATEAEVHAAARRAEAHDFIAALNDPEGRGGYEAQVGERGVKLSGGQRQRIALARVILKDAPILVLDEATSALDSEVEAAIQETLYGVMEGKTVIAIAHRLSTIAQMDRIVVLDGGRIAEEGSHQGLLEAGGLYARFWERQSGGFIGTQEANP